jgi:LPXTG-motif cell wall-anchored protein
VSDAETSAYLLMAGGLIWLLVGMVGLVWLSRRRTFEQIEIGVGVKTK